MEFRLPVWMEQQVPLPSASLEAYGTIINQLGPTEVCGDLRYLHSGSGRRQKTRQAGIRNGTSAVRSRPSRPRPSFSPLTDDSIDPETTMATPQAIISPSVLASNFGQLSAECKRMMKNGADWLHMGESLTSPNVP